MVGKSDATRTMQRRGILAAAGAVVAGMMVKQTAQPVLAATLTLETLNTTTTATGIINALTGNFDLPTFVCQRGAANQFPPITNYAANAALVADSEYSFDCYGVWAIAGGSGGTAVLAQGNRTGVNASGTANGVYAASTGTGGQGVYGYATGAASTGVYGYATAGTGVYGVTGASNQYGVLGTTTAPNSTAIAGTCTQNGSSAFSGGTTNPAAFAAFFQGTTVVQGNFAVTGSKSAVVKHPRTGDHRLLYCVESPEAWFEDFGEGTLAGGKTEVKLDPDFAALIHADAYHVFLTPGADSKGLFVTNKTASGFAVHEQQGGTSNLTFSWRAVGKRADTKSERLGKFTMPNLPLPDPAQFKVPDVPAPAVPKKP